MDAWLYPDEASKQRIGEKTQLELPLSCNVLYYDNEGALRGKTLRPAGLVTLLQCSRLYLLALATTASLKLRPFRGSRPFSSHHIR